MLGQTVSHYRIQTKLGGGGMGVVYRAEDVRLRRQVALKFLPPELTRDPEAKTRFIREAQAASSLDHPNICTIHEIDETEDGRIFLALACYEGETLKAKIRRGPLGVYEAVRIGRYVARGLGKAHQEGIVHRDLKPANIFIGNDGQVKILDFGLAKLMGLTAVTKDGVPIGTVSYMSPEQTRGEDVDPRSDIWSFGVLLYEMITGRLPFPGHHPKAVIYSILHEEPPPPAALLDSIPGRLGHIIACCLHKKAEGRYPSMFEVEEELDRPLNGGAAQQDRERSVAVLPFSNLSADPEQEYFCDGMAEEIINTLSQVPGLRVSARTSAFAFKGHNGDVREIGRVLGVEALLEGSVRKLGNRLRISAQLIDAARGFQSWSGRYDREISDLFEIQEEIARQIVQSLQVTLGPEGAQVQRRARTSDMQAYDYYLRGREFFYHLTRRGLEFARQMFERAGEIDPTFALAYAGAADSCSFLCMWFDRSEVLLADADRLSKRAIELDPDLAEAHAARGLALSLNRRFTEAESEFEAAIALDSRLYEAFYFYARDSVGQGKLEKAVELYRRASEARPEDYQCLFLGSQALRGLDRPEEAREMAIRGIEQAERHLELYPEDTRALYLGAAALVIYGQKERGLEWANLAATFDPEDEGMLYQLACIHSLAGETARAIDYLEQWEQDGALPREWLENDSDLDNLRDNPRFKALMARL